MLIKRSMMLAEREAKLIPIEKKEFVNSFRNQNKFRTTLMWLRPWCQCMTVAIGVINQTNFFSDTTCILTFLARIFTKSCFHGITPKYSISKLKLLFILNHILDSINIFRTFSPCFYLQLLFSFHLVGVIHSFLP